MEGLFVFLILLFFGIIVYIIVKERIYVRKKKYIKIGDQYNNKDAFGYDHLYWVVVTDIDPNKMWIEFTSPEFDDEPIKMLMREFVKKYV